MQNRYRSLIVDDERLARNDLKLLLNPFHQIQIMGEAESVPGAIHAIKKLNPDLIFLDIQMPGESGFELLNKIDTRIKVIFITAFDEYAIRAFEVNALDYLLKPVNPERLAKALERLEENNEIPVIMRRRLDYKDRLFLTINNHLKFLKINTILSINAAGDYSEVMTTEGQKGLAQKSLREWENRLPEGYFCRIHRSTIINMEYIDHLEEWFNYSFRVYLKGIEEPYVISRRYAAILKNRFG
ncbi:response regulator transcription factor [bacterium]|nr:response regulator transcription factor [candidate division CSSED10-310 bacterium]